MSDMSGRLQAIFREMGNIRTSTDTDAGYRQGVLDAVVVEANRLKTEIADELEEAIGDIAPLAPEVNPEPIPEEE